LTGVRLNWYTPVSLHPSTQVKNPAARVQEPEGCAAKTEFFAKANLLRSRE
jgi:hypothetical protein